MTNAAYTISVRELAETLCRSGDLVFEFKTPHRAVLGVRGHQAVQKTRPADYEAEVSLRGQFEVADISLTLRGRADGVQMAGEIALLEEIKTTTKSLKHLQTSQPESHWAQAKIYATLLAQTHDLPVVTVQLTYYHLDSKQTLELTHLYSIKELEVFTQDLVNRYCEQLRVQQSWIASRNASMNALTFPFPDYRKGQRGMAVLSYQAIRDGQTAFLQAPTGIGKTIATLFPAMKAIGAGLADRVFFLTMKGPGRLAAEKAMLLLHASSLKARFVTLTAKDKICPHPEKNCHPDECSRAKGHFDRVGPALSAAWIRHDQSREQIERVADTFHVCPFEFSLDLALASDVIIADVNYVFDPRVRLRRFFDESDERSVLLVDESHNLVDRGRSMFSAELSKKDTLALKRLVKDVWPKGARALARVNTTLLSMKKIAQKDSSSVQVGTDPPEALLDDVDVFTTMAEYWLSDARHTEYREEIQDYYFTAMAFGRTGELFGDTHRTLTEVYGSEARVRLLCLDAAPFLMDVLKEMKASVFFSATLSPLPYFRDRLGGSEHDRLMAFPSPFPEKNRCVVIRTDVRTTYKERTQSIPTVATCVKSVFSHANGHTFVYFPSYKYMEDVYKLFAEAYPDVPVHVQQKDMDDVARDLFLEPFSADNLKPTLAFAVMGGLFAEGIDLVGDALKAAIVVGVGLPQLCLERELIRSHFDERGEFGFDLAYRFPGISRVLQAAGRVIRRRSDRGLVIFLDERFGRSAYWRTFPPDYRTATFCSSDEQMKKTLAAFNA